MKKKIIISLLVACALFSSLLVWKYNLLSNDQLPSYTVDISIDKVSYTRYNTKGVPTLKLDAPKLTHTPSAHTIAIQSPHIINHSSGTDTWEIWADNAESDEHYHHIFLHGHVKMVQSSTRSITPITLSTSEITLLPKKQAYTHAAVIATQGESSLKAEGARLDFKTNTLQLLGNTDLVEKP